MAEIDWADEYGACKICQGEIPHGHSLQCPLYIADQRIKELETFIRYDVVREFSLILEHGNWEEFESHVSNVSAEWAALQSSKDGD